MKPWSLRVRGPVRFGIEIERERVLAVEQVGVARQHERRRVVSVRRSCNRYMLAGGAIIDAYRSSGAVGVWSALAVSPPRG
jgi:hypothetical protein